MPIDPAVLPPLVPGFRGAERISELERRVRTLETQLQGRSTDQVPVVTALPAAGRKGRMRMLDTDNKLYIDNGTTWVAQT